MEEVKRLQLNMLAAEEHLADERGLVAVGDEGEGRERVRDDQVGEFAGGHRAEFLSDTHRVGGVEGAGVECLSRGEAHSDAAESHHETHISGRGGAWVVVRGESQTETCADIFLGPAVGDSEEE